MQPKKYYANTQRITKECSRISGEGLWTIPQDFSRLRVEVPL